MSTQWAKFDTEAAWLEKRKGYVTSTETASLFGIQNEYAPSAFELWHIKKGLIDAPNIDNAYTRAGRILEPAICDLILLENPSWKIRDLPLFAFDDTCRMGSSFDREAVIDGKKWILELKTIGYREYKENFVEQDDGSIEASQQYEVQLQHQLELACACPESEYFGALLAAFIMDTRTLVYVWREHDPEIGQIFRKTIADFWEMEHPPEPDWSADRSLIARLAPKVDPDWELDATDDADLDSWCAAYREAKDGEKAHKEKADESAARIIRRIGKARYIWTKAHRISASTVNGSKRISVKQFK